MRPLILKTARMLTDCMDAKFGLVKMDENRIEYKLLDAILTDDMAWAALKMGGPEADHTGRTGQKAPLASRQDKSPS